MFDGSLFCLLLLKMKQQSHDNIMFSVSIGLCRAKYIYRRVFTKHKSQMRKEVGHIIL